jgi:uncharacterized protein (DUF302 family)
MLMTTFGTRKSLRATFDETLVRVTEALKSEGFGVLTEIDVQQTLEQKLGVDFRRYKILGACNPPFAHQALEVELEAGLMMPCNVIVYDEDERGRVAVAAIDPTKTVAASGNPKLAELAGAVKDKLTQALARLE